MNIFCYEIITNWLFQFLGRFYDGWYRPPGLKRMQHKYLKKLKKSNQSNTNFTNFWVGNPNARIKCGRRPKKVPHCGGRRYKPCLFNLRDDPCEYFDMSEKFPIIYEIMLRRLNEYRKKMVRPRMMTYRDPAANPKNRNGVWLPWKIHPSKKKKNAEKSSSSLFGFFNKFPFTLKCKFA